MNFYAFIRRNVRKCAERVRTVEFSFSEFVGRQIIHIIEVAIIRAPKIVEPNRKISSFLIS